jgi:hypothetical protein
MKLYDGERRYCTIPTWIGIGAWYTKRFNDLCKAHDQAYIDRTGKLNADFAMYKGIYDRGYWYIVIPVFLFLNTFGFFYYYTK